MFASVSHVTRLFIFLCFYFYVEVTNESKFLFMSSNPGFFFFLFLFFPPMSLFFCLLGVMESSTLSESSTEQGPSVPFQNVTDQLCPLRMLETIRAL